VGGIAKGNIVREIDALGGVMARATDIAGIHFKMLNQTKGMAVWGNRAQVDKAEYRKQIKTTIEKAIETLTFIQGFCRRIKTRGESVSSVILDSGEENFLGM
jgi:tRNA uridine 5-carboxymethylaminomethyl modification enzyme